MCLVTSKCVPKSNGFVFTLSYISIFFILKLYWFSFPFSSISNFCFSIIANFFSAFFLLFPTALL